MNPHGDDHDMEGCDLEWKEIGSKKQELTMK